MKIFRINFCIAFTCLLTVSAFAESRSAGIDVLSSSVEGIQQERTITGQVVEKETGEPLIGVNVLVKGSSIGTITDMEGHYSIRVSSDNDILVFSYVGQVTVERSVKGITVLDIEMESDIAMLDEVVVYTGYMNQRKADLTGSVSMANSKVPQPMR